MVFYLYFSIKWLSKFKGMVNIIKTNKILGLSTIVVLPLVVVSCNYDEEITIINLELSPKANIGMIAKNEVSHLNDTYQNVNDQSLTLIKKLFDIQGTETTDQNLISGLKIKMLSNGLNKTISLSVDVWLIANSGFKINGNLTAIDSMNFTIDTPPIDLPVLGDILTQEIANSFFASGGKWAGKTTLVEVDFEGFTSIANSALSGKSLISVIFPNSITIIGQNALANNQLTSLSIPNSVTEIGNGAFANNRLTLTSSITLPAQFDNPAERERIGLPFVQPAINLELSAKTNIEVIAESEVAHLSETYQDVNDGSLTLIKKLFDIQGTTTNDQNLMDGLRIKMVANGLNKTVWLSAKTGFKINDTLTEIDSISFAVNVPPIEPPISVNVLTQELVGSFFASGGKWAGKTSLVAKDFKGFTAIGDSAFQGLPNLSRVDLPNEITRIEDHAFFQTKLEHITLGRGVEHIGFNAFSHCFITEIILPPSLKTMGESAFSKNRLSTIIIPSSLKIIPNGAFLFNQLTSVSIPNTITEIGDAAFFVNQLTEVNIPNSVISIGKMAFAFNRFSVIPNLPNGIPVDDIFIGQQVPDQNKTNIK